MRVTLAVTAIMLTLTAQAGATSVCTEGYMGGPPASQCGGRIFPEAALRPGQAAAAVLAGGDRGRPAREDQAHAR